MSNAATPPVSRLILGPFNRVEGDLEVQLEVQEGRVRSARVNAPLYRGFENMLVGREPMDALTIVPRICGICSVSQSVAAAKALADAAGVTPPPNGQLAINLMLACENLADHLTHFYVFFMPDFTRPVYAKRDWFAQACKRFAAVSGTGGAGGNGSGGGGGEGSRALLAARARWFALMGTLGGKWPHTGSVLPGGSSRALEPNEVLRMRAKVREMRQFLESTLFGTSLESFAELGTLAALQSWQSQAAGSDLALFLDIAQDAELNSMGTGSARFLSYGAYTNAIGSAGDHGFAQGVWTANTATLSKLKSTEITEDPRHAWLTDAQVPLHPTHGITEPLLDKPGAYTWNKAPRLNGAVMETGAIARQLVDGQALVRAAVAVHGASVGTRVLARLMEVARIVPLMEQWLGQLQARGPFHTPYHRPANGQGVGLSEAARGALGHWLRIEHGKLSSYQIVAPTSWNFSPRDSAGVPGALEAALVDTAVSQEGEAASESVAVQHIVRSFDPCMVCTVH